MALHVVNEARRCLNCKKPLCRTGCPINTPIPEMIQSFLNGGIREAGEMLFSNNPLSLICSLVCDHEKQCEGHCILGKKGMPVHISSIENYISDNYFDKLRIPCEPKRNMRAAVIGSGPAGITIAILLAQKGYDVTIFESRERIGGVLRYGIPEFRLPKSILDRYKAELLTLGIKVRPNTSIGGAIGVNELFRDGYKAIFIGTGVWRPKTLGIKGETLGNVHFAIDYLTNPDVYNLGDDVIVIGGGNSAMDVARTALRKNCRNVTAYLRKAEDHMAASSREVDYAKADGVQFRYCHVPVEITPEGVLFRHVSYTEDGTMIEGEEEFVKADSVIISISQGPKNKIVSTTSGLTVNQKGLLVTNGRGETSIQGIFGSGDVVLGARTVVEAVRDSKIVAQAMHEYMSSLPEAKTS